MLRHGSLSDETQSYSSRVSSRATSPVPSSPGACVNLWGSAISRKPSRNGLDKVAEEKQYAVPESEYFSAHHYRTSALARKLGLPDQDEQHLVTTNGVPKKNLKSWYSRRPRRKGSIMLGSSNGSTISVSSKHHPRPSRARRFWQILPDLGISSTILRCLGHPLVPTRPLTILFALVLIATTVSTITLTIIHALSTDKSPLPWRQYCQDQRAFPHEYADTLDPVNVFVGVFSVDSAYERRHLIRSTYVRHSRPIDPTTGKPANNVQVKFILGKPTRHHARRVALEMETFNDIVVLDVRENMNRGKTHAFFTWANENATVPVYYRSIPEPKVKKGVNGIGGLHADQREHGPIKIGVGFQKVDFVVKTDDDSFLVLSELERHLRVAPRNKTYWGYLIRNMFMGGECYALSSDLVNYVASSPEVLKHLTGAEDKRVAKWMRIHPDAGNINWVTERCWMYDHPKSGTTYAHGFLFPDEVNRVRREGEAGLSVEVVEARGGEEAAKSYSTVTKWHEKYHVPLKGMTMEEEVEALVEGGGRFGVEWKERLNTEDPVPWSTIVFEAGDERLRHAVKAATATSGRKVVVLGGGKTGQAPTSSDFSATPPVADHYAEHSWRFGRPPSDLMAEDLPDGPLKTSLQAREEVSEGEVLAKISAEVVEEVDVESAPTPIYRHAIAQLPGSLSTNPTEPERVTSSSPKPVVDHFISSPTLRYDPELLSLRQRRFLGLPYGGTVVVHYLKRNEWFLETSLILLGRWSTWDGGITPALYEPSVSFQSNQEETRSPGGNEVSNRNEDGEVILLSGSLEESDGRVKVVEGNWFGAARMYGSPIVDANGRVRQMSSGQSHYIQSRDEIEQENVVVAASEQQGGQAKVREGWSSRTGKVHVADPDQLKLKLGDRRNETDVDEEVKTTERVQEEEVKMGEVMLKIQGIENPILLVPSTSSQSPEPQTSTAI